MLFLIIKLRSKEILLKKYIKKPYISFKIWYPFIRKVSHPDKIVLFAHKPWGHHSSLLSTQQEDKILTPTSCLSETTKCPPNSI
jgi:hypothetical protein